MASVQLKADMEQLVAAKILQPQVRRVTNQAADLVRRYAPDAKVWITQRDERVRKTHVDTDRQTIPANLRFEVPKPDETGHELARAPRDPSLSPANRINCRCEAPPVVGAIARTVATTAPLVNDTRVTASVTATFARIVESENPSAPDGGGGWMRRALEDTAKRTRA